MLASDLHVHLDGSIRGDTLVDLARSAGLLPATTGGDDFLARLRFRPGMSLRSCLSRFEVTIGLMQTRASLARVARELVCDCYRDGVRHLEVRFCPALHTREGLTAGDAVEAVLRGTEEGVGETHASAAGEWLSARVILSILEGMATDEAGGLVDLAIGHADAGVCGIDLAGDESLFDAGRYERAIRRAGDAGLGITIHAGEGEEPSHVAEAVTRLRADRIGHGVAAASDDSVLSLLAERGVTVEICLSSNLHTGAVAALSEHPLTVLSEAGVPVALATDNRFFSNTTLSREYELASDAAGAGADTIAGSVLASADAAFLPDGDRAKLRELYRVSLGAARS